MSDVMDSANTNDGFAQSQVISPNEAENGLSSHLPDAEPEAVKSDLRAEEPAKPEKLSTRDAVAKAMEEVQSKGKAAAEDANAKVNAKEAQEATEAKQPPQRAQDGKFARPEQTDAVKAEQQQQRQLDPKQQAERAKYAEPPARFLPEARTKWANVPNEIKAEMHRVEQEREAETQQYRQSHEKYERIRQFDEIAASNGRDLRQSLEKVVQVERALAANPVAGLEMILRELGPRRPDGSAMSLYEVAQHIVQGGPQAYQQNMARAMQAMQAQQAPRQAQPNAEVEALRQEIMTMKAEHTVVPVVERFASEHPDFAQLAPQIKTILDNRVVDAMYGQGLTLEQKLSEAYRMAGGGSSSFNPAQVAQAPSTAPETRPVDPDGRKSVAGAPAANQSATRRVFKSNRDALDALMPR